MQIKASTLESQGVVGKKVCNFTFSKPSMISQYWQEISNAYKFFNLNPANVISDDYIIGQFKSRMEDTGPSAQPELKLQLRILGNARGSQRLLDTATDGESIYSR